MTNSLFEDTGLTTTGTFNYKTTGFDQRIEQNPTMSHNPVVELVAIYAAEYDNLHEKPSVDLMNWIRSDTTKMNNINKAFVNFRAYIKANSNPVNMCVSNGRVLQSTGGAGLGTTGFTLHQHHSRVIDWDDEMQVKNIYYPEIAKHVKQITGALFAFCNSHSIRKTEVPSSPVAAASNLGSVGSSGKAVEVVEEEEEVIDPLGFSMKNPITAVHNDFAPSYAEMLALALEQAAKQDGATEGACHNSGIAEFGFLEQVKSAGITADDFRHRYQLVVVNAWRNCDDLPLDTMPLAMCDRRTVGHHGELVNITSKIKGGTLETVSSMHSGDHKWYWYPGMTKDEVLLFKTFDSAETASRGQLHTAFQPTGPSASTQQQRRGRHSCEARVFCLVPLTKSAL